MIDFIAKLFGLSTINAVRKINEDFSLGLALDRSPTPEELAQAEHRREIANTSDSYERWRERMLAKLSEAHRHGYDALLMRPPDQWTDGELLSIRWLPLIAYRIEILAYGDMSEQMELFRKRRELNKFCNRVLKNTPKKSGPG